MFAGTALLLLLAANDADAPSPGALEELEACAARIEELKARNERGAELDRLLRRAQQLAAELEPTAETPPRAEATPHAEAPSPEELRERADAARDEADRLAAEIAALDVRIQDAHRARGVPGAGVGVAALGTGALPGPVDRLHALVAERALRSEQRLRAEAEAARLDAEARAADRVR